MSLSRRNFLRHSLHFFFSNTWNYPSIKLADPSIFSSIYPSIHLGGRRPVGLAGYSVRGEGLSVSVRMERHIRESLMQTEAQSSPDPLPASIITGGLSITTKQPIQSSAQEVRSIGPDHNTLQYGMGRRPCRNF